MDLTDLPNNVWYIVLTCIGTAVTITMGVFSIRAWIARSVVKKNEKISELEQELSAYKKQEKKLTKALTEVEEKTPGFKLSQIHKEINDNNLDPATEKYEKLLDYLSPYVGEAAGFLAVESAGKIATAENTSKQLKKAKELTALGLQTTPSEKLKNLKLELDACEAIFAKHNRKTQEKSIALGELATFSNSIESGVEGNSWGNLINEQYRLGHYLTAEAMCRKVIHETSFDVSLTAQRVLATSLLAQSLMSQGSTEEAIINALSALEEHDKLSQEGSLLSSNLNSTLASSHTFNGKPIQGLPFAESAVKILEGLNQEKTCRYAICLSNLAAIENQLGLTAKALSNHEKAIEVFRQDPNRVSHEYPKILSRYGIALMDAERKEEALSIFFESLAELKSIAAADHPNFIHIYQNLASLLVGFDRLEEAEKYIRLAQDMTYQHFGEASYEMSGVLHSVASFEAHRGNYQTASETIQKAASLSKKVSGEDSLHYGHFLLASADIKIISGDLLNVDELVKKGMDTIRRNTTDKSVVFHSYLLLANTCETSELFQKQMEYLQKARDLYQDNSTEERNAIEDLTNQIETIKLKLAAEQNKPRKRVCGSCSMEIEECVC